jgi:hypothetical protein
MNHTFSIIQQQGYTNQLSTLRDYILKLKKQGKLDVVNEQKVTVLKRRLHAYLREKLKTTSKEEQTF